MKPKRVTSWRGPVTRHRARSKQLLPRKAAAVRPAGKTLSDLTGPRFEPHTRRSIHKHMTETTQTKYTYTRTAFALATFSLQTISLRRRKYQNYIRTFSGLGLVVKKLTKIATTNVTRKRRAE